MAKPQPAEQPEEPEVEQPETADAGTPEPEVVYELQVAPEPVDDEPLLGVQFMDPSTSQMVELEPGQVFRTSDRGAFSLLRQLPFLVEVEASA